MALDETTMADDHELLVRDDDDEEDEYGGAVRFLSDGSDNDDIDCRRISRLVIEGLDGNEVNAEVSEEEKVVVRKSLMTLMMEEEEEGEGSDKDWASTGAVSLSGTHIRETPELEAKEKASETKARGRWSGRGGGGSRRRRMVRERGGGGEGGWV